MYAALHLYAEHLDDCEEILFLFISIKPLIKNTLISKQYQNMSFRHNLL